MWIRNQDTALWTPNVDTLSISNFELLKQDLKSLRFYQKVLSGALFSTVTNVNNIYDVLTRQIPKTYYYNNQFSPYVKPYLGFVPEPALISSTSSQFDFLNEHLLEYGQTLKTLFTPKRLINDQIQNLHYVDVATTDRIEDLTAINKTLTIDGVRLKNGHRVLVKDQKTLITLSESEFNLIPGDEFPDPLEFFEINYNVDRSFLTTTNIENISDELQIDVENEYLIFNDQNGIYEYQDGRLIRTTDLDEYSSLINFTVCVKLGTNREKQFSLQRLLDGTFAQYQKGEPIYFTESKNYVLRNRMDYNNLYELVLNDTLKHGPQTVTIKEISYTIPERAITVGEFGSIIVHQEDFSNFVNNKFKTTLRSISQTNDYYWICGDDGYLLRVSKVDFKITRIVLKETRITRDLEGFEQEKTTRVDTTLNGISFVNNLRGVVVGKFNQIWVTSDSGENWTRIFVPDFEGFNFNSVIYLTIDKFYVGEDNGVFIEFSFGNGSWTAFRRRISQFRNPDDEYLLVDDIRDLDYFVDNSGFFTATASFIAIGAENGYLFLYDIDGSINQLRDVKYDFYYVGGSATQSNLCSVCEIKYTWVDNQFGDIQSVSYQESNSKLLFSTFDSVYQVSPFIGAYSSTSSNILAVECTNYFTQSGVNSIYSYESETIITGINSLWKSIIETITTATYSPDIYVLLDDTSVPLTQALDAANAVELWFRNYCESNSSYTGTLYILPTTGYRPGGPAINERWLDFPRQILSLSSNGTGNLVVSAGGTLTGFQPFKISYTQSLVDERTYAINSGLTFLDNPQPTYQRTFATWSRPTDMILLAFFNESDPAYHNSSPQSWQSYTTHTTYTTDYNDFVDIVSPLTGSASTKLNSFTGILYPIISGTGPSEQQGILNGGVAALIIQAVSAIYGSTLSVAEIESIPGLSTDTTVDYPGESFTLITNNDTSGWTDGWGKINAQILATYNPYTGILDPNGNPGLIQHGWKVVADKNQFESISKEKIQIFEPVSFTNDLNETLGFGSASTSGTNVYHSTFFSELKPRLLFMDYDAGSKLYWFDDYGQYRLPERVYIPVSYLVDNTASTQSFIDFRENSNTIFNGNTGVTSSYLESNWINYWKDRMKTFEYHTHLDDAYKVEPSFRFESSNSLSGIFTYTASNITTNFGDIQNFMPVSSDTDSRFRDSGTPITLGNPTHNLYFYKFLGIWAITIGATEAPPKKGDVLEIECSIFKGKFIINKVLSYTDGTTTHYQYFYTDFNENILNNLNAFSGEIKVKNLNKYATTKGGIKSFTATYSTSGYSQGSYKKINGDNRSSFDIDVDAIGSITSIELNEPGFGFNIGDSFNIPSGADFGGTVDITITVSDLDYKSEFLANFKSHYINYAYDIEATTTNFSVPAVSPIGLTDSFQITGKYNRYSAYYNLQANIEILTTQNYLLEEDIRYQSSFLNFGYSPTYNLLSYLNFIDNTKYLPEKEFLSMPCYEYVPGPDSGVADTSAINDNLIYMDFVLGEYSGVIETNKLLFGLNLKHLWDSFMKWTFIDLILEDGVQEFRTDRLLIVDKFKEGDYYILVFHDKFRGNNSITSVSLLSRRTLQQISDDLQYINNIQRPYQDANGLKWSEKFIESGFSYTNYESDIGYKISTDSYTRILLSDADIIRDLSGIVYTDYKFELAIQIVKLEQEFNIVPTNVSNSANGKYRISVGTKHNLRNGEGVVIQCTATQSYYPQILGYRAPVVIDDYNFELDVNWAGFLPKDPLNIFIVKKDPFLNFQPCDIFDLGVGDKQVKQSVQILPENYDVELNKYFLIDVDPNKYRYRLLDGLDLTRLTEEFYWVLDAEVSDAIIGLDRNNNLLWYQGTWEGGRWFGGTWLSGTWKSGDWYSGVWTSKNITDKKLSVKFDPTVTNEMSSKWYGGRWFDGTWENGSWYTGRWYAGNWKTGRWYDGTWNDGTWNDGRFTGGIWVRGTWKNGIFNTDSKRAFWLDGNWQSGDFENGIWFNGTFNSPALLRGQRSLTSRFGTKSFSTRKSIWHSGTFVRGEFHSFLNLNDQGVPDVSENHGNSIWNTGKFRGSFYGGTVNNIEFDSSIWYGGILKDISIVRIDTTTNSFTLDGVYRFNLNDKFYVMDNLTSSTYSVFGSTIEPIEYRVLDTTIDEESNITEVIVEKLLSDIYGFSLDTGITQTNLKVVSKFKNSAWVSGVWRNGYFDNGRFLNGIWYDGYFSGTWG